MNVNFPYSFKKTDWLVVLSPIRINNFRAKNKLFDAFVRKTPIQQLITL